MASADCFTEMVYIMLINYSDSYSDYYKYRPTLK